MISNHNQPTSHPNAAAQLNVLMQPFRRSTDPLFPATHNSMNTHRSNPLAAPLWAGLIPLLVALATLGSASRALAQANASPPERMTYQGFLTDANGTPLGNTAPKNYDVIFRIWKSESSTAAGDRLWTEQQTVTVDKGYFSVLLGEGGNIGEAKPNLSTVFTGADASDRWVGITVKGIGAGGADATILPRLRMLTSPYSYLAQKAISATIATSVDGGGVTSGTVADARLSSNVALRNGGNTFSGQQTFTPVGLRFDSSRTVLAQNAAGNYETFLHPRWTDNVTYLNFGSGGFNIRNNAGAPRMFITDAGNVGIGTTGPQDRLEVNAGRLIVNGGAISTDSFTGLGLQYNFINGEGAIMSSFNDGYGWLSFYTKESVGKPITRRMAITAGGYVGIGTDAPTAPLTIQNDSNTGLTLRQSNGKYASFYRNDKTLFLQLNQHVYGIGDRYASYDGDSNWDFGSDRKLKKDIVDAEPMLERTLQVQVRRFRWKESEPDSKHMLGVIAQEVQPLFPEMVGEFEDPQTKEKSLTVGYGDFAVIAIKALQEFKQQHDAELARLKTQLAELTRDNQALLSRNEASDKRLAAIEALLHEKFPQQQAALQTRAVVDAK